MVGWRIHWKPRCTVLRWPETHRDGEKGEEITGILIKGGMGRWSARVGPMMKGKNKAESSSSGAPYGCGGAKLERGMSAVKIGGCSWVDFIGWEGGEEAGQGRVMAAAGGAL
jgi:hypothetical protein